MMRSGACGLKVRRTLTSSSSSKAMAWFIPISALHVDTTETGAARHAGCWRRCCEKDLIGSRHLGHSMALNCADC